MKKHIPNFLTCMNLIFGVLGCISIIKGDLWNPIYFVLLCGFFDFLDGFVARLLKVKSEIGKQLDSLADMISFGLLPAVYMQAMIAKQPDLMHLSLAYAGILIAPFSALRLAKFNIDERQTEQFIGLPTPANAIMLTSLTFLPIALNSWELIGLSLLSCFLLVSHLPMLALKFSTYDLKNNWLKYLLIVSSISFVAILGMSGVVYIIPFYILLSLIGNFISKSNV
jgi:CDP-diacylglycerol---serine O-phosphatidyltransferase